MVPRRIRGDAETHGTRLTYRVYNIAPGAAWPVAVAHRFFVGYQRKLDQQLSALCADIEQHQHDDH
ncbi:MAG TPA: hypothetical protein VHX59_23595 [Mycobacteriales bacterium]|nr:hypothetical protein [Mycobacteriales bacterium]